MNTFPKRIQLQHLLVYLLIVVSLAFSTAQTAAASEPAPDPDTAQFEIRFMKQMSNHHASGVGEGFTCVLNAVHPELMAECQKIVIDQANEIRQMRIWLNDWYSITYEPEIPLEDHETIHRLAELEESRFEIEFLQTIIPHHLMAVEMAQDCVANAAHPDLVTACQQIIESQTAQVQLFQSWLCEWYSKCEVEP